MKKNNLKKIFLPLAACSGLALALATTAQAATIAAGDVIKLDVSDAGDGAGTKTADWNTLATTATPSIASGSVIRHGDGAVVDNTTIALSGAGGEVGAIGPAAWTGLGSDPYYNSLSYTDFFWGSDMTVTFGGLDAGLTYNVRLYHLLTEGTANVDLTVTDGAGFINRTNLDRSDLFDTVPLSDDLIFNGVSADGSGNIIVNVNSTAGVSIEAVVLEAVAIPEPTTTALLGLGGLALILRRRK